jgi:hypothetical protein
MAYEDDYTPRARDLGDPEGTGEGGPSPYATGLWNQVHQQLLSGQLPEGWQLKPGKTLEQSIADYQRNLAMQSGDDPIMNMGRAAYSSFIPYHNPGTFLSNYGPLIAMMAMGGAAAAGAGGAAGAAEGAAGAGWTSGFDLAGGGDLLAGGAGAGGAGWTSGYDLAGGGDLAAGLPTTGGNMGFFDDVLGDWVSGSDLPGGGDLPVDWTSGYDLPGGGDLPAGGWTSGYDLPGGGDLPSGGVNDILNQLKKVPTSLLKGLGIVKPDGSLNLSSLFGGSGNNVLNGIAAIAPSLAAISYARNQDPFDMSKLETAYSQVSPTGLTGQFDYNTGLGRNQLVDSLTNRGVMGSSFGNMDLTNYNTQRDVGRNALLTGGASVQADIANKILQGQILQQKNKNDLYGNALLALSGIGSKVPQLFPIPK